MGSGWYVAASFCAHDTQLAKLGIETMITKLLKNNANMLSMLFLSLGEDKNVIDENHHKDIKLFKENRIREIHEICRDIV